MSECNHNCSECSQGDCESRKIEKLKPNNHSSFKKTFAVISGKGGVGKSLVTCLLATALNKKGHSVAIIDADVTGPSIPQAFGLKGQLSKQDEEAIYPLISKHGIKIMSANCLLPDPEEPIVWRGPLIAGFVQQLYTDVTYGDVEYLLIDMPPGTGDIPLTVFQMYPVDGIIVVSSPQELVSMVVAKSINMAKMMCVNIVGVAMNMACIKCPKCGENVVVFGNGKYHEEIEKHGLDILSEIPIDPKLASAVDEGKIEEYETTVMDKIVDQLEKR